MKKIMVFRDTRRARTAFDEFFRINRERVTRVSNRPSFEIALENGDEHIFTAVDISISLERLLGYKADEFDCEDIHAVLRDIGNELQIIKDRTTRK